MISKIHFFAVPVNLHIKVILNLNGWENINLLVSAMAIQILWEYLQKPHQLVFRFFKQEGQLSVIFANNSYLPTDSELQCQENNNSFEGLRWKPGFVIQFDKSILKPTQKIELLSFVIDLVDMTIFSK